MESLQQGTGMHANFRRDFFFWLGVVVLPVFWAWFTLGRKHSKLERGLAFGWLAVLLAIVAVTWPGMAGHYQIWWANLQFISLAVGGALCVWLALRITYHAGGLSVHGLLLCCFFGVHLFSPIVIREFGRMLERICIQSLGQIHALAILIPALLHLSVGPAKEGPDESA